MRISRQSEKQNNFRTREKKHFVQWTDNVETYKLNHLYYI
jgi:hypothetical protein